MKASNRQGKENVGFTSEQASQLEELGLSIMQEKLPWEYYVLDLPTDEDRKRSSTMPDIVVYHEDNHIPFDDVPYTIDTYDDLLEFDTFEEMIETLEEKVLQVLYRNKR